MHLLAPLDVEWPRPFKQTMALTAGTRLGHYNVTALIGEGGAWARSGKLPTPSSTDTSR